MTREDEIRFLILRSIGNFLVLFAIFGALATFGPVLYYEVQYKIVQMRGVHFAVKNVTQTTSPEIGFADILSGPKEQILTPIDPLFSILIPKIGANARVFPNINAANPDIFLPILQKGVVHAQGTFLPGQKGNIYLFAHSADDFWDVGRYNAIFYLLKELRKGDDVIIFYRNVRHNYTVTDLKIVNPLDVSFITKAGTGKELLILQTCWPPGTAWQRLMVFAQPK